VTVLDVRPTQGAYAAYHGIRRGMELAVMVRDEGPCAIGAFLDELDRSDLYALTVALAAMVPVDTATPDELLSWLEPLADGIVAA
jgi:hypothetical protein